MQVQPICFNLLDNNLLICYKQEILNFVVPVILLLVVLLLGYLSYKFYKSITLNY